MPDQGTLKACKEFKIRRALRRLGTLPADPSDLRVRFRTLGLLVP